MVAGVAYSARVNVAAHRMTRKSLLNWYRTLIALRKRVPARGELSAPQRVKIAVALSPARDGGEMRRRAQLRTQRPNHRASRRWSVACLAWSHHPEGKTLNDGPLTLPEYGVVIARRKETRSIGVVQ